eukprot:356805-Rhodomonas_salina.1
MLSSLRGEKCPQQLLRETQVGKAMPFSIFFPLYTLASSWLMMLSPSKQSSATSLPTTHSAWTLAIAAASTATGLGHKSVEVTRVVTSRPLIQPISSQCPRHAERHTAPSRPRHHSQLPKFPVNNQHQPPTIPRQRFKPTKSTTSASHSAACSA